MHIQAGDHDLSRTTSYYFLYRRNEQVNTHVLVFLFPINFDVHGGGGGAASTGDRAPRPKGLSSAAFKEEAREMRRSSGGSPEKTNWISEYWIKR